MKICGFQKVSIADFNGYIGATIFLYGCNFKCLYCHNRLLVTGENTADLDLKEILEYLEKRKPLLDAVCITGGEATMNDNLPYMLGEIKKIGYLVKLDTNGTNLEMVKQLVENKLVDYIALDVKSDENGFDEITNSTGYFDTVKETIKYLIDSNFDYELRTTIVKEFHNKKVIENIANLCEGAKVLYLQKYVASENCIGKAYTEISEEEALEFANILKTKIKDVKLRNY